jgi:hypothetical protein
MLRLRLKHDPVLLESGQTAKMKVAAKIYFKFKSRLTPIIHHEVLHKKINKNKECKGKTYGALG